MASSSSPAPAHLHGNLIELYNKASPSQQLSNNNSNPNTPPKITTNTNASVSSSSTHDSKKKRPPRRFLPMVSKLRKETGGSSSSDSLEDMVALRRSSGLDSSHTTFNGTQHTNGLHNNLTEAPYQSALGQRIYKQYQQQLQSNQKEHGQYSYTPHKYPLSRDFLRLPPTLVRLKHGWVDICQLQQNILQCHTNHASSLNENSTTDTSQPLQCRTKIIHNKDAKVGLGMSLREFHGCVYVQAVLSRDGTIIDTDTEVTNGGPAYVAGLRPGDRLLGLNGLPFLPWKLAPSSSGQIMSEESSSEEVLKSVGGAVSRASIPLVIHYQRDGESALSLIEERSNAQSRHAAEAPSQKSPAQTSGPTANNTLSLPNPKGPYIHPFAKSLSQRNIIQPGHEEQVITQQLRVLSDRTRQWESKLSFRLRASDYKLRPQLDPRDVEPTYYASFFTDDGEPPPFFSYKYAKSVRSYAPSTPMIQDWRLTREDGGAISPVRPSGRMSREAAVLADLYAGLSNDDSDVQDLFLGGRISTNGESIRQGGGVAYPRSERYFGSSEREKANDVIVPLMGVRKAICVRILNSFLDNRSRLAFSIWCYDVESGMEWYAPVRYHEDFRDLRLALMRIDKSIGDIPFPTLKWSGFGLGMTDAKESASARELRREQLESFLRKVFAEVYRGPLHPYLAEVAIHLQTFVGCDNILSDDIDSSLALNQVAISETTFSKRSPDTKSEPDSIARLHLQRSIQRYVYRIFLLPAIESLVTQFVDATKQKMDLESSSAADQVSTQGKYKATSNDVEKIRDFIDRVQELILEGCHDDLTSITQRRDFAAINDFSDIDNHIREAVREQVELEVYVPLRTSISKYLVCAFYNEDAEMKHKMRAIEHKPQSYFRIQPQHRSRSDWKSVSTILQEGVGRSTLPSVKLRALVAAAKEIALLHSEERGCFKETSFFDGPIKSTALGADDFLPIFIFCFVQARLERPCALCELLQTMCDPLKLNGETGYYLASFHAAMTHINELDLTEANTNDELSIFLDILPD